MNITAPALNLQVNPTFQPVSPLKTAPSEKDKGFASLLGDLVNQVDGMQKDAAQSVNDVVTGRVTDIHQVSVKVQEAGVAFDLMLSVRNRLMQAYDELLKIQV